MANYNTNGPNYNLMNYNNNNNIVKRKESIHSGHFMISQFEVDEEEDEIMPQVPQDDIKMVIEPVTIVQYGGVVRTSSAIRRGRVKSDVIETSLTKLFECMSLAYRQKLTSPKWNRFKGIRLRWKDKIRLNNVIWRCWHMQFVSKKNALVCQFASPLDADTHNKPEAVVLEGKYWKRKLHAVTAEYKKWRQFFHIQRQDSDELADMLEWQPGSNDSNSNASMLMDEDYMEFMSDTLFSTISSQSFFFPDSKELSRVAYNADFIQPSLVQLQPNLDELMDGFEPFQDLLCPKLPTVIEEQYPSPSSSLSSSLPSQLSHSPKSRPLAHHGAATIIALAQSSSIRNSIGKSADYRSITSGKGSADYQQNLSGKSSSSSDYQQHLSPNAPPAGKDYTNLAGNDLSSALAANNQTNLTSLSGNQVNQGLVKSEYHLTQSANLPTSSVVKPIDYLLNVKQESGTSQPLHHHPNIIYSTRVAGALDGTVSTLLNTSVAKTTTTQKQQEHVGYNFVPQGGEKTSVFSYAPAASNNSSKPAPPPAYPLYSRGKSDANYTTQAAPSNNYDDNSKQQQQPQQTNSGGDPAAMYNNYPDTKPGVTVQYNYGKSIHYYDKAPPYKTVEQSYKGNSTVENPYKPTLIGYDGKLFDVNQAYDKVNMNVPAQEKPNSSVNQAAYSQKNMSSVNHGVQGVNSMSMGGGMSSLNQGSGAGQQYAAYHSNQYIHDVRNEYSSNLSGSGSSYQSQLSYSEPSYPPTSGGPHPHVGSTPQYSRGGGQSAPPTASAPPPPTYSNYYREPSPYQQALDFKLPSPSPSSSAGAASTTGSSYQPSSSSRRTSLVQPPPQSPDSGVTGPCSPVSGLRRPGSVGEDYALPPKPQSMKMMRNRTRSSCNLLNPRHFLNTATDPNLVNHNSALLAQLLTSNSHTSYGGLPKASAVCTGETISCPGYTGRSRTPDSVYVPPPQEQVVPPAPPSYPPYPPKSAFLVSSQSEGSLFSLFNSRAANFTQEQNQVLQRQARIIHEKNQNLRNFTSNGSSSGINQSQYMSGASSTSSLAATSPSSSRPPDSPEPLSPPTGSSHHATAPPQPPGLSPPRQQTHYKCICYRNTGGCRTSMPNRSDVATLRMGLIRCIC
uniref:MLX-interacting protein n=1 Tax=Cacopsylla melanoneura TaxID=428564 RepID=A0A8D8W4T9_9HEMI